jgi:hypothetical protein
MPALGHSRRFGRLPVTSGLPRTSDVIRSPRHVSKVPTGDLSPRHRFSRIRRWRFAALGCLLDQSKLNSPPIFTQ